MPTPLFKRGRMVSTCKYIKDVYLYVRVRKMKKIRGPKGGREEGRKKGKKGIVWGERRKRSISVIQNEGQL